MRDTAAVLMAALRQATDDGLLDLMAGDMADPDGINDFVSILELWQGRLAESGHASARTSPGKQHPLTGEESDRQ